MPLGKTSTSSAGSAGKVYNFDPSILEDQMDAIKKEKEMLRGILEGQYDEFADKDLLQAEADKLKETIARRKMTLDVYSKDQEYRDLIHAEDPTKMVKAETTTRTNPSRILDLEKPSTTTKIKYSQIETVPVKTKPKTSGIVKGLGKAVLRGMAEAPAYEFLNPPSAGPSDPDDPIYQFERGLITQDEFIRRLKQ